MLRLTWEVPLVCYSKDNIDGQSYRFLTVPQAGFETGSVTLDDKDFAFKVALWTFQVGSCRFWVETRSIEPAPDSVQWFWQKPPEPTLFLVLILIQNRWLWLSLIIKWLPGPDLRLTWDHTCSWCIWWKVNLRTTQVGLRTEQVSPRILRLYLGHTQVGLRMEEVSPRIFYTL